MLPVLAAAGVAELGRRLLAPRTPVIEPADVDVRTYFSDAELARGRRYARPQLALGMASEAVELGILVALALRPAGPLRAGRRWEQPVAGGAAVAAGLGLAMTAATLPLRAASRRRRIAVGLDTQSWRGWLADLAKAGVIQTGFAAAAGAGVVAGARRYPRRWWLPAAAVSVGVGGVLAALAPVVLDPIFNDFTRLPEGETRSDVLALAEAAGVSVGEVYSVDASRRTTAANAYVTGLGPTKRVVLFDTMLDRYTRDEVRLVVAHELGHVRHRDVPRTWPMRRCSRRPSPGPSSGSAGSCPPSGARRGRCRRWRWPPRWWPRRWDRSPAPCHAPWSAGPISSRWSWGVRRGRCVHLVRARDRAAERRRPGAAEVADAADGLAPADGGADRGGGGLSGISRRGKAGAIFAAYQAKSPTHGARSTTTQFWPPKPNALAAATRTSARRAVSGT